MIYRKIPVKLILIFFFILLFHIQTVCAGIIQDIEGGKIDAVKEYLKKGGNVNAKGGRFGESLLCNAIMCGKFDIVQLLVDHGADINAKTGMGDFTPLARAANFTDLKSVKLLVERGAKVNEKTGGEYYTYPLMLSVGGNFIAKGDPNAVFLYLLDHGADINARNGFGRTPLSNAILYSRVPCVRALLKKGVDPNALSSKRTPLEEAIDEIPVIANFDKTSDDQMVKESIEIVSLLLQHGANPKAKTKKGKTLEDFVHEKFKEFETHMVIEDITFKDSSSPIPVAEIKPAGRGKTASLSERDSYYAKKKFEVLKLLEKYRI